MNVLTVLGLIMALMGTVLGLMIALMGTGGALNGADTENSIDLREQTNKSELESKTTNARVMHQDCSDIPNITPGVYQIFPSTASLPVHVYCLKNEKIWTVIQRRIDGSVNFFRNWTEYENGFGDPNVEYWIGNKNLHLLTSEKNYQLRVDLTDWEGNRKYASYSKFAIGNAASKYKLTIGGYSGNAGNSFRFHNDKKFTTYDQDNDFAVGNCAVLSHGAWWYQHCYESNLNGRYFHGGVRNRTGIVWWHFRKNHLSLKSTTMMIRPT